MMPVRLLSALAVAGLVAGGCASLAPYGAQRGPGGQGYAETRIESDRYRVTYQGVGDAGRVADYALLRAAELTLEQGQDWFTVTRSWTDGQADPRPRVRPSVSIGAGTSRWGGYSRSGVGVGVGVNLSGPGPTSTTLEIVLGRGDTPDAIDAYDAREVRRALSGS